MTDSDRSTLIGRTRDRLERVAHLNKKAAEQRRREEAEAERRRIASMPEEQRAANLDRLRQMMADAGLAEAPRGGSMAKVGDVLGKRVA